TRAGENVARRCQRHPGVRFRDPSEPRWGWRVSPRDPNWVGTRGWRIEQAAATFTCPKCGAVPGAWCSHPPKYGAARPPVTGYVHKARWVLGRDVVERVEATAAPPQRRRVIVESPYAGDVERNLAYLRAAMRDCA